MNRTVVVETSKRYRVELTADEVEQLLRNICAAPKHADVQVTESGATIAWKWEETSPAKEF